MKISVPLVIEIDPDDWTAEYPDVIGAAAVRKDVKEYFLHGVAAWLGDKFGEDNVSVTLK